jgi:hypothetical protein
MEGTHGKRKGRERGKGRSTLLCTLTQVTPRTSRQEAEELSNVISQTTEALETYKEKQLRRQVRMYE